MTEIFWIEDYLSGIVLENKYYSTHAEAATRRNELGYGLVRSLELQNGGAFQPGTKGKRMAEVS